MSDRCREASIMRPWPTRGCCPTEEKVTNYPRCLKGGVNSGNSQHGKTFICEKFSVASSTSFFLLHKRVAAVIPLPYGGSFL